MLLTPLDSLVVGLIKPLLGGEGDLVGERDRNRDEIGPVGVSIAKKKRCKDRVLSEVKCSYHTQLDKNLRFGLNKGNESLFSKELCTRPIS